MQERVFKSQVTQTHIYSSTIFTDSSVCRARDDIKRKVLWKDEQTGATLAILRIPKGVYMEQRLHSHPYANQFTLWLSGEIEFPDGTHMSYPEGEYGFDYCPRNEKHGAMPDGINVFEDIIYFHYWDGSDDWDDSDTTDP